MAKKQLSAGLMKNLKGLEATLYKTEQIDVSNIKPHKDNFYQLSDVEVLADDIERQGLQHNLIVVPDKENSGKYIIVSGHRRYAAVTLLIEQNRYKSSLVPCHVTKAKDEDELMLDLIMLNATSRVLTDGEMLKQYENLDRIMKKMKDNGEITGRIREHIAEKLRISSGQVSKIENISKNAVPEVKEAIEKGGLSISTATEIAKLDEDEQKKIITTSEPSDISYKEIKSKTDLKKNKKSATYGTNSAEEKSATYGTNLYTLETIQSTCSFLDYTAEKTQEFMETLKMIATEQSK
jgi:ParB family chromosome partitioning protein